jgi:hypothetical protein
LERSAFCHLRLKPAAAMLARPLALASSAASRTAAVAALAIGFSPSVIPLKKALATAEAVMRNDIDQTHISHYPD